MKRSLVLLSSAMVNVFIGEEMKPEAFDRLQKDVRLQN
jgi:hypothetical protein